MKAINGFNINYDFSKLIKVADLIYFDGPLLSHYMSDKGENYLFHWADADDDYNRWIVLRTDILSIQQYLDKKINLRSLFMKPNDGFVFSVDIDDNINYTNIKFVPIEALPEEYIPTEDSFYSFKIEDGIDLSAISQKYSSGILEIHIGGKDVKYGSIPLHKLAPIIPKIEDIRKSMSSKYTKRIKSSQQNMDKKAKQALEHELRLDTQYEFLYSLAGSIRIILKPINQQMSFAPTTYSDDFAREFTGLFVSGFSKDNIQSYSETYDKQTIKKYSDFMSFLNSEKLSIGVKWCNMGTQTKYSHKIEIDDTQKILSNLSNFDFDNEEELKVIGRFYSLNVKTGSYSFESTEGDDFKSTGFLDEQRKQIAFSISFNKTYQIIINRKVKEPVGRKQIIKDTIISFIEEEDN
jgi:hypothetical protein